MENFLEGYGDWAAGGWTAEPAAAVFDWDMLRSPVWLWGIRGGLAVAAAVFLTAYFTARRKGRRS